MTPQPPTDGPCLQKPPIIVFVYMEEEEGWDRATGMPHFILFFTASRLQNQEFDLINSLSHLELYTHPVTVPVPIVAIFNCENYS